MRWTMVAAALPLMACGAIASGSDSGTQATPSGGGTSRSFAVSGFTGVELAGHDDVDVRVGPAFSVRADGPSDELDKLDIRKDGATLKIGRQRTAGMNWSRSGAKAKVTVTMPSIAAASLAGSGDLRVDRVAGGDFRASLAGSGDLALAQVSAAALKLSIAGSGGIAAAGQAQSLSMSIAGSGDIDASRLRASSADVSIAGSGNASADVNGEAKVSIMGSGDVTLGANARCRTSKMGSGTVRCG